jgi:hypothetical protein
MRRAILTIDVSAVAPSMLLPSREASYAIVQDAVQIDGIALDLHLHSGGVPSSRPITAVTLLDAATEPTVSAVAPDYTLAYEPLRAVAPDYTLAYEPLRAVAPDYTLAYEPLRAVAPD